MRFFLHLAYDGTHYSGWQRQINTQHTVQEVIENILFKFFKKKITVYGCGRTDSGVHASQYIAHMYLDEMPSFDLKYRLNKNLPNTISIYEIVEVADDQHARYDAVWRTYDYFIHWKKDSVLHRHSSYYDEITLDFDLMQQVTNLLQNTKDFKPLCKQPDLYKNTVCEIQRAALYVNQEKSRARFTITGNRFLRGMVRYCIFFLLEVGSGAMTLETFQQILQQKISGPPKRPAYPNGLFLSSVEYPYIQFQNQHFLIDALKEGLT